MSLVFFGFIKSTIELRLQFKLPLNIWSQHSDPKLLDVLFFIGKDDRKKLKLDSDRKTPETRHLKPTLAKVLQTK